MGAEMARKETAPAGNWRPNGDHLNDIPGPSAPQDYAHAIESVARTLLGEPNTSLSSRTELRFGSKGSLAVDTEAGIWHDHEADEGGGCLDLIKRQGAATDRRSAAEWLKRNGLIADRPTPAKTGPPDNHPNLGTPVARWTYTDPRGHPVLAVYRFEIGGEKTIRQATPTADGWQWKGLPKGTQRPLYGLHTLQNDEIAVVIVEGEKARDSAAQAFPDAFVTCWPGGTSHAGNVDLTPIRGRDVYLWPDADDAGHKAMRTVADRLEGIAASVRVVDVSELPEKSDAADVDEQTALSLIAEAKPVEQAANDDGFDLEAASVGDLLSTSPPQRQYLVRDCLPLNIVAVQAAAGGTGKSFGVLQLAVSVATGTSWFGLDMGEPGSTLIISAEDDRHEIHRRLTTIVNSYWPAGLEDSSRRSALEAIGARMFVVDRVGEDNRLTAYADRELIRTRMAERIITTAEAMPEPPRLIVLDPLSRFDGGKPNEADDGTRLIECAEAIRVATGATVLLPHHVNKASIRDADAGQEAIRGTTGIVDGARWVSLMATLRRDDARKYDIDPDDAARYVMFKVVKGNYGPPLDAIWLQRGQGGVLAPTTLRESRKERQEQKQDERHRLIVDAAAKLIRRHGRMTATAMRTEYGGATGVLGAGDKAIRASLKRAVEEGDLVEVPGADGRGQVLEVPKGQE